MEAASSSKDLLNLEHKTSNSASSLDSAAALFICKEEFRSQFPKTNTSSSSGKLVTTSLPRSQFLGKAKDFLGVMAEANARLEHEVKEKSGINYDIETLTGNEKEYIEMDLVLGVADLHTPEAVAAAESAIVGSAIPLDNTESSDDDDDEKSVPDKEVSLNNGNSKKRKKIIEVL